MALLAAFVVRGLLRGTIAQVFAFFGVLLGVLAGSFVADWVGARLTVGVSILLSGGFMLAFGETDTHTMGLTFQACIGLCAGAEVGGGVKLITSWFTPQRRGFAMGVFLTATSCSCCRYSTSPRSKSPARLCEINRSFELVCRLTSGSRAFAPTSSASATRPILFGS